MRFSPRRRAIFRHRNFKKCSETLTSKCASRHSGVQCFDIGTSKSAPNLTCFVHFHFKMCFSPQRRAIFRHRNFKKWSGADVLGTFSLQNVLLATTACNFSTLELKKVVRTWRALYIFTWNLLLATAAYNFSTLELKKVVLLATAACNFSTSELQKVLRTWRVLYIFTAKCASRHSGAQFFDIRTEKVVRRWRACAFSLQNVLLATGACNFWFLLWPHDSAPAALTNIWCVWIFFLLTFGACESSFFWLLRHCIFFLLTLLLVICFSSAFQLSILSEVYYLNLHFLR